MIYCCSNVATILKILLMKFKDRNVTFVNHLGLTIHGPVLSHYVQIRALNPKWLGFKNQILINWSYNVETGLKIFLTKFKNMNVTLVGHLDLEIQMWSLLHPVIQSIQTLSNDGVKTPNCRTPGYGAINFININVILIIICCFKTFL